MNILTTKRDHEWLLSQGFTPNQPVCQQSLYAMYINTGCYAYDKTVAVRGTKDTLCVMRQVLVPDENSAWAAKLISTTPTSNGLSANVGVGRTPKDAIENLAHKEDVQIQTFIDVDKPLEEVPNLTPEEERQIAIEYLKSVPSLMDLLDQKMRSSIHTGGAGHKTQQDGTPCDPTPGMYTGKRCCLRSLTKFYENALPGPCDDIFNKKLKAIRHMWWDDNTTTPDPRESARGQSDTASDLVEKTFKKPVPAMSKEAGEAWLLDHGFKSEDPMYCYTIINYKWIWNGCIGGKERRIRVIASDTADGVTSWTATLYENRDINPKYCEGISPMAALDELLRKYELTSEEEKS